MKKAIAALIIIIAIGGVAYILMQNKSKNEAKIKSTAVISSYSVAVAKAEMKTLSENLSLNGTVYADRELTVVSETQGKIISVYFNIGDAVGKGRALVKVDDEIKSATLANAEASFEKAKKDLERYEQLNKEKSVNDVQLESARLAYKTTEAQYIIAKRQLSDTKIVSPIPGVVTAKNVEAGTVLAPGAPVATIIDISNLKIRVNVPEEDVFKIKVGDKVELSTDLYAGEIFEGIIRNINSKADEAHTYPVEIKMKNNKKFPLKAGMFIKAAFPSIAGKECIVIPRAAISGSIKSPKVYVVDNGIAILRNISIGIEYDNLIEVKSGVASGELVVISGQINLKDGSPVVIIK